MYFKNNNYLGKSILHPWEKTPRMTIPEYSLVKLLDFKEEENIIVHPGKTKSLKYERKPDSSRH